MNRRNGYTLTEIALATAVLAIVGAVAVPTYQAHVLRARETAAIADIGSMSLIINRWQIHMGQYPETLAEVGLDSRVDPWGRPYVYLNIATATPGHVRKDKNLVPINTDYDLFSEGPDGQSVAPLTAARSRDDIVRANDGGFIGRAEHY